MDDDPCALDRTAGAVLAPSGATAKALAPDIARPSVQAPSEPSSETQAAAPGSRVRPPSALRSKTATACSPGLST